MRDTRKDSFKDGILRVFTRENRKYNPRFQIANDWHAACLETLRKFENARRGRNMKTVAAKLNTLNTPVVQRYSLMILSLMMGVLACTLIG